MQQDNCSNFILTVGGSLALLRGEGEGVLFIGGLLNWECGWYAKLKTGEIVESLYLTQFYDSSTLFPLSCPVSST